MGHAILCMLFAMLINFAKNCYCHYMLDGCNFLFQVNKILSVIPRERNTYLYSATMTKKVAESAALLVTLFVECSLELEVNSKVEKIPKYPCQRYSLLNVGVMLCTVM